SVAHQVFESLQDTLAIATQKPCPFHFGLQPNRFLVGKDLEKLDRAFEQRACVRRGSHADPGRSGPSVRLRGAMPTTRASLRPSPATGARPIRPSWCEPTRGTRNSRGY